MVSSSFRSTIKVISDLCKVKITFFVALTTALGFITGSYMLGADIIYPVVGIFLLACGASALNQVQESDSDILMDRTKSRPIPAGLILRRTALLVSLSIIILGSVVILLGSNIECLIVGLVTLFWYNGIYTPLKKVTPFAIIPGALVGALPPVAGWVASGADIANPNIWVLALYMFMWQIPHFWILVMIYGEDYEKGGYPTLKSKFSSEQLKKITFFWILPTVSVALLIPVSGMLNFNITSFVIFALSVWFIYESYKFLTSPAEKKNLLNTFVRINIYTLVIITSVSIDKLVKIL
ncbi:MAG: protoheme IX farnesyltransferase [Bacteroidetes bacterium]|nr:protoheme IX farnesyltransferase [Bacteroidota bacterium]